MIQVSNLGKRHGNARVLGGVSLSIARGEVAVFMGPSGAGKSTLLRCLNGLESFEEGSVRVGDLTLPPSLHEGRDAALLRALRRRVGFVFQQFFLFPHMTAMENLLVAPVTALGEPVEQARERAEKLLDRVGLLAKQGAYPRSLSGGQQQRVAIARALMMRPEVVLFDEPTSALDPVMAAEVVSVVADLARDGLTMAMVTHSLSLARKIGTTLHLFADGSRVESGPPDQILSAPQHPVTRAFLALES